MGEDFSTPDVSIMQCLQVIYVNSADYTAWAYRWQCLESLGKLDDEMSFINEMASRSPKNYQLWNHRRRFAFKRGVSHAQEVILPTYAFIIGRR